MPFVSSKGQKHAVKGLRDERKNDDTSIFERDIRKMELWDAYDSEMKVIEGMTLVRGEEASIPAGVYHLVSHILVEHVDGTYLLMQRDPRKSYPNMWEATAGGSALKGETAEDCARRELREETGIESDSLTELRRFPWDPTRCVYVEYLCLTDCDKTCVKLQEGETIAYKWATAEEICRMTPEELLSERMRKYIRSKHTDLE